MIPNLGVKIYMRMSHGYVLIFDLDLRNFQLIRTKTSEG